MRPTGSTSLSHAANVFHLAAFCSTLPTLNCNLSPQPFSNLADVLVPGSDYFIRPLAPSGVGTFQAAVPATGLLGLQNLDRDAGSQGTQRTYLGELPMKSACTLRPNESRLS